MDSSTTNLSSNNNPDNVVDMKVPESDATSSGENNSLLKPENSKQQKPRGFFAFVAAIPFWLKLLIFVWLLFVVSFVVGACVYFYILDTLTPHYH